MAKLRIGTCSWKYPSWIGLVYSGAEKANYLREYAANYETVEVDQWFWSLFAEERVRLPNPADVDQYRSSVPGNFRFTVKAPNSVTLTHFYKKSKTDPLVRNPHFLSFALFAEFLEILNPLGDSLGPVMLQFEYLNRQKMKSQKEFQTRLASFVSDLPSSYHYAVETRNGNYLNASYFEFLNTNHLVPVLLQGYWMPAVTEVFGKWNSLLKQQPSVILRLQGPDRQKIEKDTGKTWNRIVAPKDDELPGIVGMAKELLESDVNVYINVNNHYEGSAPITIDRIRALL
jgi:uncharacterized protein YecE (DUF72 family)